MKGLFSGRHIEDKRGDVLLFSRVIMPITGTQNNTSSITVVELPA
jgi:hypothetical protein